MHCREPMWKILRSSMLFAGVALAICWIRSSYKHDQVVWSRFNQVERCSRTYAVISNSGCLSFWRDFDFPKGPNQRFASEKSIWKFRSYPPFKIDVSVPRVPPDPDRWGDPKEPNWWPGIRFESWQFTGPTWLDCDGIH